MYPKTNLVRMTKSGGLFGRDIKTASGKMKNVNKLYLESLREESIRKT
jgi:hypothetical protein